MRKFLCKVFGHKWRKAPWSEDETYCCIRCGIVKRDGILFERYFREYVKNGPLGTAEIGYDTVLAEHYIWADMLNIPDDMYGYSRKFVTIERVKPEFILLSDKDVMLAFTYPLRYRRY